MRALVCTLALLCLAGLALAQDAGGAPPPSPTSSGKGKRAACKNVTCDRTVLEECEQPVIFVGGGCCPVCPMTDVCATVECGENETCSEQNGEAVCCTEINRKNKVRQHLRRVDGHGRPRDGEGKKTCSRRANQRPGVNRGPCVNATCDEDEVCIGVRRLGRAFCCPKPNRTALPACNDTDDITRPIVLGFCHAPGTEPPERPTRNPDRAGGAGGRKNKKKGCKCGRRGGRRSGEDSGSEGETEGEGETEQGEGEGSESPPPARCQGGRGRRGGKGCRRGQQSGGEGSGPGGRGRRHAPNPDGSHDGPMGGRRHGRMGGHHHGGGGGRRHGGHRHRSCKCGRNAAMKLRRSLRTLHRVISKCRLADSDEE